MSNVVSISSRSIPALKTNIKNNYTTAINSLLNGFSLEKVDLVYIKEALDVFRDDVFYDETPHPHLGYLHYAEVSGKAKGFSLHQKDNARSKLRPAYSFMQSILPKESEPKPGKKETIPFVIEYIVGIGAACDANVFNPTGILGHFHEYGYQVDMSRTRLDIKDYTWMLVLTHSERPELYMNITLPTIHRCSDASLYLEIKDDFVEES